MSEPIILRGMTWDHPRGYQPMVATAQAYMAAHPQVRIEWEKRSLKEFEELPVERLVPDFDLIVIDHPFVGAAAQSGVLLPLDEHLPAAYLGEQGTGSVGQSHASYEYGGHHWALAIDAATPVAFWSAEGLGALGRPVPRSWEEVLDLGRAGGLEIPSAPINCLMNFYMFCQALGETPFVRTDAVVSRPIGVAALDGLREILSRCDPACLERNPIASHEWIASGRSRAAYCPFAYGYSNYAREESTLSRRRLVFGEPPLFRGKPLVTTLGGTGLAVSARRPVRPETLDYARYVASPEIQRTIYVRSGGQPGHRSAWLDEENNRLANGYFVRTLPALERAYVRPRYAGHLEFQERGGPIVHAALRGAIAEADALRDLDALYRHTLRPASHAA